MTTSTDRLVAQTRIEDDQPLTKHQRNVLRRYQERAAKREEYQLRVAAERAKLAATKRVENRERIANIAKLVAMITEEGTAK